MDLLLVRHAAAEERDPQRWPDDSLRPLTERGRERFAPVVDALCGMLPKIDVLLSSTFARAWQTAQLLAESCGKWPPPRACRELEFGSTAAVFKALKALTTADDMVIVAVGHEPCLSELASAALTGIDDGMYLDLKKGAAVRLEFVGAPTAGAASMNWLLTPKLARSIREQVAV
jgi:phosphohistidine phosphatase SixA